MTSPIRVLRQIVAPNGRHRPHPVAAPAVSPAEFPAPPVGGMFVQAWDDCVPCGRATAGVLHKSGWTCGDCLTSIPAGGETA